MELWDGYVWRESRRVEGLATLAYWMARAGNLKKQGGTAVSFEDVIQEFANYDGEWVRRELERMGYKGRKLTRAMRKRGYLRPGVIVRES